MKTIQISKKNWTKINKYRKDFDMKNNNQVIDDILSFEKSAIIYETTFLESTKGID